MLQCGTRRGSEGVTDEYRNFERKKQTEVDILVTRLFESIRSELVDGHSEKAFVDVARSQIPRVPTGQVRVGG